MMNTTTNTTYKSELLGLLKREKSSILSSALKTLLSGRRLNKLTRQIATLEAELNG